MRLPGTGSRRSLNRCRTPLRKPEARQGLLSDKLAQPCNRECGSIHHPFRRVCDQVLDVERDFDGALSDKAKGLAAFRG